MTAGVLVAMLAAAPPEPVAELVAARAHGFEGYVPAKLGFTAAQCQLGGMDLQPRLWCEHPVASLADGRKAIASLAPMFRAGAPAGWQTVVTEELVSLGPPRGDAAIRLEVQMASPPDFKLVLSATGAVPADPPSANPIADLLAASAKGFKRYSPAPLGFIDGEAGVFVRLLDTSGGDKELQCERRSGSKSAIRSAFRELVAKLEAGLPKDWRVEEQSDVFTAFPPDSGEWQIHLKWGDRDPGFSPFSRAARPPKDERYALTLEVDSKKAVTP
jgi:hypothetical protein